MQHLKDAQGRYRTASLFKETIDTRTNLEPVFTLRPEDTNELVSLKKLYLEAKDPSEFTFAEQVFGTYEHWQKLIECTWFHPHLEQWRKELELKLISIGVKELQRQVANGSVQAAKALMDKKWKDTKAVGRPKKARTIDTSEDDVTQDAARVFSINGGKH